MIPVYHELKRAQRGGRRLSILDWLVILLVVLAALHAFRAMIQGNQRANAEADYWEGK